MAATLFLPTERQVWSRDGEGFFWTTKHEDESIAYPVDWADRLNGDTIDSVSYDADGVTLDASSNTTTVTTVTVSGTDGTLEITVTTGAGYTLITKLRFVGPRRKPTNDYDYNS